MSCEHIQFDNLCGNSCKITGASVTADCGSFTGERCAPMLALDVREGRLDLDEIDRPMNAAVRAVLIQLGDLEPEPPPLLVKPRTYAPRNRRRKGKGKWQWSPEARARQSERQRQWWAERKAAR